MAVTDFQAHFASRTFAQNKFEAKKIYQEYMATYAPNAINVSAETIQGVDDSIRQMQAKNSRDARESILLKLFQQAQKDIFHLMNNDSFPRFLESDLYRRYASTLRARQSIFVRVRWH